MGARLPTGTVTFLFTDLESSTRLWEEQPEAMRAALARHDELLSEAVEAQAGHVIKGTGDGLHAVFAGADSALTAAVDAQRALGSENWGTIESLRVRMGLHTGVAEQRGEDYFGPVLNRAARLMSAGHGGQVLVSAATQELVRDQLPESCELLELGECRLRDLGRPERVFQVIHPDLQREFAPLRTLDVFPGNLPLQLSSLVGRDVDLERVAAALAVSPVVTLTGVGGVGKTRLALQVAAEVLPRYRDGAWLCELQMVRDPAGVVDAVAGVFRVSARPGSTLLESLVAYLSDQKMLIVLDNCEHLLRPVAGLVSKVEAGCPGVRVLATSREGLNLRGEQILVVPSLGVPEEGMDLEALTECEAVRLFSDRARAVKADFRVDNANADGVSEVCRRLDGVPLAVELAAARVTAMNPAELARRLDRRFRLLRGGERVAIERHQTLRATIDWSYDLLSEAQRHLLARLAVFAGGCTLEAAERVCAGDPIEADDVLDLLSDLIARSLVVAEDDDADTRYRLLETIRQYAEERLAEAGETDSLGLQHARYYGDFAAEVNSHIWGPDQPRWAARLARERENLLSAMTYALDSRNVDLAFGLFCGLPGLGQQINELVVFDPKPLLALPGATDHPGSALALLLAGFKAWDNDGDDQRAISLCQQALEAAQRFAPIPGEPVEVWSALLLGQIAHAAGATDRAVSYLMDGVANARAAGLDALAAGLLGSAASTLAWSDPGAAQRYATEGLLLARQTGAPHAIALNLNGLAQALAASDPDQARALLSESLELGGTLGYESPSAMQTVAFTAARLEEWDAVLRAARVVLHHQTRTGALGVFNVAAILNLVACRLAEDQPEPAAVLQGTVTAMLRRPAADVASQVAGGVLNQNDVASFVARLRHNTTRFLIATLGQTRVHELRARGAAMDESQACTFARAHVDRYLARTPPPLADEP